MLSHARKPERLTAKLKFEIRNVTDPGGLPPREWGENVPCVLRFITVLWPTLPARRVVAGLTPDGGGRSKALDFSDFLGPCRWH